MTGRELAELAGTEKNLLNIGTTDYMIRHCGGGDKVTLMGQLITWAQALDGDWVKVNADFLETLETESHYNDVVYDKPIKDLDEGWDGDGATAFVNRWSALQAYIGEDKHSGRRDALVAQCAAMRDLGDAMKSLQSTLTVTLDGGSLSQVRDEYVKALCASDSDSSLVDEAIAGIGLGATIGSPGLWPGIAAGAIIGGVFGLIKGTMNDAEADLSKIAGAEVAVSNVGDEFQELSKTLVLKQYGDDNKVNLDKVEYAPNDPLGDDWNGLDDGWEH